MKKYSIKQKVSLAVGIPAGILAILSVNSEVLWIPGLCVSVLVAIMMWNGYFKGLLEEIW